MGKTTLSPPIQPFSQNTALTLYHWRNFTPPKFSPDRWHLWMNQAFWVCVHAFLHVCVYRDIMSSLCSSHTEKHQSKNRRVSSVSFTSHGLEEADLWMFILHKKVLSLHVWKSWLFSQLNRHIINNSACNIWSVDNTSQIRVSITYGKYLCQLIQSFNNIL